MQNPRHRRRPRLVLYKQPHLAQFRTIITPIGAWSGFARCVLLVAAPDSTGLVSDIPSKLLTDSTFLNSLHSHVNTWIKAIQAVTKLTRDVSSGTASLEINFWMSLEGVGRDRKTAEE
ncbi:hypothetical protein K443DRAFT_94824 [Laccaria amethystina LaAM-08-1]|uniref:Dynein heavy chain tail domain-containing protein n=1 Tax=Laccaria amethystina LaAM-08-1 TaxID=1095629 RepID=A0A0C9Y0U3_9AGAR|nr:hypothetical protein K443DRAFT_94824 [Laccaria amethystina LaAM-08-1]